GVSTSPANHALLYRIVGETGTPCVHEWRAACAGERRGCIRRVEAYFSKAASANAKIDSPAWVDRRGHIERAADGCVRQFRPGICHRVILPEDSGIGLDFVCIGSTWVICGVGDASVKTRVRRRTTD